MKKRLVLFGLATANLLLSALLLLPNGLGVVLEANASHLSALTARRSVTQETQVTQIANPSYKVVKVVDGDTIDIDLNGTKERIRLIGIDTPETVAPGKPVG